MGKSYFTLKEICRSKVAEKNKIENIPGKIEKENIENILIPNLNKIREYIRLPFIVNSGFRCEKLNKVVGGTSNSYHKKGLATDGYFKGLNVRACWEKIKNSELAKEIDQCILYEDRNFIHFGFTNNGKPRGMFFEK